MTGDGRGGGDDRRHQVRTATPALAALKITVGSRSATLAGGKLVRVHPKAHGATRVAPLEARVEENGIQSFVFGWIFT